MSGVTAGQTITAAAGLLGGVNGATSRVPVCAGGFAESRGFGTSPVAGLVADVTRGSARLRVAG